MRLSAWTIILIILTCWVFFSAWDNNIEMNEKYDECTEEEYNSGAYLRCMSSVGDYNNERKSYELFILTFIILSVISWRIDTLRKVKK